MMALIYLKKLSRRVILWQRLAVGLSVLVLAGVLMAGLTTPKQSSAEGVRSCGDVRDGVHNSIANNPDSGGGCGALTPDELITDINNGNPDDQAGVFAHFGLPASEFERFKDEAVIGIARQDGTIVDDEGNVVMTNAWSIGRIGFSYSTPFHIDGVGDFFKSAHTDVLQSEIPIMLMFDDEGTVEAAVLTSCGNPVQAEKVRSEAECKELKKEPVEGEKNTFSFTTHVRTEGFAKVVKVEYFANGEEFAEEEDPLTPVTKTFTEDSTVTVKVTVGFPGHKTKVIEDERCKAFVEVEKKVVKEVEKEKIVEVVKIEKLPVTGPGGLAGLFVGTSLAGAVGHRLYAAYRGKKRD